MVTEREGGDVPVGYLVGVGLVALPTLFALVPRRSSPNLSFRLGLLLNEVPIAGRCWLLVWTALAFARVTSTLRAATLAAATSSTCIVTAPAPRAARS
jgi:hypothetical protein